jgi:hypothetical protein
MPRHRGITLYRADNGRAICTAIDDEPGSEVANAIAMAVAYSAKYHCDVVTGRGLTLARYPQSQKEYSIRTTIAWRRRMKTFH